MKINIHQSPGRTSDSQPLKILTNMKTIHHLLLGIILLFATSTLTSTVLAQTDVAIPNVPTLGNYPATMVAVAADTTVTPDAAPSRCDEH